MTEILYGEHWYVPRAERDRLVADLEDLRDHFQFLPYKTYTAAIEAILNGKFRRSEL